MHKEISTYFPQNYFGGKSLEACLPYISTISFAFLLRAVQCIFYFSFQILFPLLFTLLCSPRGCPVGPLPVGLAIGAHFAGDQRGGEEHVQAMHSPESPWVFNKAHAPSTLAFLLTAIILSIYFSLGFSNYSFPFLTQAQPISSPKVVPKLFWCSHILTMPW